MPSQHLEWPGSSSTWLGAPTAGGSHAAAQAESRSHPHLFLHELTERFIPGSFALLQGSPPSLFQNLWVLSLR